jgi:hypothetical protein
MPLTIPMDAFIQTPLADNDLVLVNATNTRLVVITQKGFSLDTRLSALKKYSLSHVILVPGITTPDANAGVISDYILPVVINII